MSCSAEVIGSGLQGKNPVTKDGKTCTASREQRLLSVDQEEYYIPSVDLLTAQVPYIIEYFQYNQSFFYPNLFQTAASTDLSAV